MPKPSSSLIEQIYRMAGVHPDDASTDAELLDRYVAVRDERAFSALMMRHGMMVWSICRRILDNTQDVEEAYQTTFLALACKARKIHVTETLSGWLHQVAHQTALAARRKTNKRRKLQEHFKASPRSEEAKELAQKELHEELHGEIAKLPEKLRVAVVLHYLEGKTQLEVAHVLGVTEPAVRDRLSRGEAFLEKRLRQRGFVTGAAALGSLMAESATNAGIPPGLVAKTVTAATAFRDGKLTGGIAKLTQEVLKHTPAAAPWWKSAWMITVLVVSGLGLGAAGVVWKSGFFGVGADGPPVEKKHATMQAAEKNEESTPSRLDLYGDPLPPGALARLGTTRFHLRGADTPHSDNIVVTPDKKLFFRGKTSRNDQNPFHCYDLTTGKVVNYLQNAHGNTAPLDPDAISSVDGRIVAQRTRAEGTFAFWDMATGNLLDLGPEVGRPNAIAISPKGKTIAIATESSVDGTSFDLMVYDATPRKRIWRKTHKGIFPYLFRYSPDGETLMDASSSKPGELVVRRWQAATGAVLRRSTIVAHGPCSWSRDGRRVAASPKGEGNTICIWDVATGRETQRIQFDGEIDVASKALSTDGKLLAVQVQEKNKGLFLLCLYDVCTRKLVHKWDRPAPRSPIAFSEDSKWIVCVVNEFIQIWDVESGKMVNQIWADRGHEDGVSAVVFAHRNGTVASGSDDKLVQWKADSGSDAYSIRRSRLSPEKHWGVQIPQSTISPNGEFAACADYMGGYLWGATTKNLPIKRLMPLDAKISPNNKILAIYGLKHASGPNPGCAKLCLFDTASGRCFLESASDGDLNDGGATLAFSPNSRWLAIARPTFEGSKKSAVRVWDVVAGKVIAEKSTGPVFDITFSQDGRTLAVCTQADGLHNLVTWWRVRTNNGHVEFEQLWPAVSVPPGTVFRLLTLSPDGGTLAGRRYLSGSQPAVHQQKASSSDSVLYLWETATGEERCRFNDHGSLATSLAFAPDGRRLASGHWDSTILIWDVTGRLEAGKLRRAQLSERALSQLWVDLGRGNAQQAGRAIWTLAAAGAPTVSFFESQLQPVRGKRVPPESLSKLIDRLENDDFAVRQKASLELKKLGRHAEAKLREALNGTRSAHWRRSAGEILRAIERERLMGPRSGDEIRAVRATEVLGQISDARAGRLLERLSSGDADAALTQAAQATLRCWKLMQQ